MEEKDRVEVKMEAKVEEKDGLEVEESMEVHWERIKEENEGKFNFLPWLWGCSKIMWVCRNKFPTFLYIFLFNYPMDRCVNFAKGQ